MTVEQNYQPQGRDTSAGPQLHTYIPQSDGSILVGGVAYFPQPSAAPVVASVAGQVPIVVKPGEEAKVVADAPAVTFQPQHVQITISFLQRPSLYFQHVVSLSKS